MNDVLTGLGILVTRPRNQSAELTAALAAAGGKVFELPVIEITPRPAKDISQDLAALPAPDIIVYVSRNAVSCGVAIVGENKDAKIAAIGPATKSALEDASIEVDISPASGFDSEHLLEHEGFRKVAGQQVLIVRGQGGREMLGDTLRKQGASVNYLAAYTRTTASADQDFLSRLIADWGNGAIDAVIVMSVESLTNLLKILPIDAHQLLRKTRLVTPSERVIQTATESVPGVRAVLAKNLHADSLIKAIAEMPT